MNRVTYSESAPQPKSRRNPKRPAVVKQLTSNGYTISRAIMHPDGRTEFVLSGGAAPVEEPKSPLEEWRDKHARSS
jgi:hypothetical protein